MSVWTGLAWARHERTRKTGKGKALCDIRVSFDGFDIRYATQYEITIVRRASNGGTICQRRYYADSLERIYRGLGRLSCPSGVLPDLFEAARSEVLEMLRPLVVPERDELHEMIGYDS
jgi:hypothetical protein